LVLAAHVRKLNRLLDVGCGIGIFVQAALDAGWEAHGFDVSKHLIRYGQERLGVSLRCADVYEVEYPPHSFDVVVLWDVLEHVVEPVLALSRLRGFLRLGGRLLLQTPNVEGPRHKQSGDQWSMFVTDHFVYFAPSTLRHAFETAGFRPGKLWMINNGDTLRAVATNPPPDSF